MRKRLFVIMIVIAIIFLGASVWSFIKAISHNEPIVRKVKVTKSSEAKEVLVWASNKNYDAFNDVKDEMDKKNSKYIILLEYVDDASILDKYENANKKPDIILASKETTQKLIDKYNDKLYDFTNKVSNVSNSMRSSTLKDFMYGNKVYGLPFNTEPTVMLYNKKDIDTLKIDVGDIRTWDDYLTYADKLKKPAIFTIKDDINYIQNVLNEQLGIANFNLTINTNKQLQINKINSLLEKIKKDNLHSCDSLEELKNQFENDNIFGQPVNASFLTEMIKEMPEARNKYVVGYIPAFDFGGNNRVSNTKNSIVVLSKDKESNVLEVLRDLYSNKQIVEYNTVNNGLIPCYEGDFIDTIKMQNREDYFNKERIYLKLIKGGSNTN